MFIIGFLLCLRYLFKFFIDFFRYYYKLERMKGGSLAQNYVPNQIFEPKICSLVP